MVLEFDRLEKYPCSLVENLVRVGNLHPENPNHFWNALFYGFKSYRSLTVSERLQYIQHQRDVVADRMVMQEWMSYAEGFHAHRQILAQFRESFLSSPVEQGQRQGQWGSGDGGATAIVLRPIPDRHAFLENVLHEVGTPTSTFPTVFLQTMNKLYDTVLTDLEVREGKTIPVEKRTRCQDVLTKYTHELWHVSTESAFHAFTETLRDPHVMIPFYMIPYVISYLDFHVFIMDHARQDLLSLNEYYEAHLQKRALDHCVLLLYDGKTFESLGVIRPTESLPQEETSETDTVISRTKRTVRILRLFPMSSDIAQICYKRVMH